MDQPNHNILLLDTPTTTLLPLEPSSVGPQVYNCGSWSQDASIADFRDVFHPHELPISRSLDGEGHVQASTRSLIQESRQVLFVQAQLQQLPPDKFKLFRSVYSWVEGRFHVLNAMLIKLYHETAKEADQMWPCTVLGVLCALGFLFYSRLDSKKLHNIPFAHLKAHSEQLATSSTTARTEPPSDLVLWMSFIVACGEQRLNTRPGKSYGWFTMEFNRSLTASSLKDPSDIRALFKQFLYDEELQDPLLRLLMEEDRDQSWMKRSIHAKIQELKAIKDTPSQTSASPSQVMSSSSSTAAGPPTITSPDQANQS